MTYMWLCKMGDIEIIVVGEYLIEHISMISSTSLLSFDLLPLTLALAVIAKMGAFVVDAICALKNAGARCISSRMVEFPHWDFREA